MGWLGRGDRRRRGRRPYESGEQSTPTYIVERDAPHGPPMDPTVRWFRRAVERITGRTYDAYPDHDQPFSIEVVDRGPTVPVAPIRDRLPKPRRHPVALFVKRNGRMREVKLLGLPLEMALDRLNRRIVAGWVMDEIAGTLAQMQEEDDMLEDRRAHDIGQGMVEYALIIALIAIVAIVALLFLGNQISGIFTDLANCLPGGTGC